MGKAQLPPDQQDNRRALARAEIEHLAHLVSCEPIGVQIGVVRDSLPQTGFQIFRQPERRVMTLSPFRLGENPNVRVGVAMITSAAEALSLHEKAVRDMWSTALKGEAASAYLRSLMSSVPESGRVSGR